MPLEHCVLSPGPSFVVPTGYQRNSKMQSRILIFSVLTKCIKGQLSVISVTTFMFLFLNESGRINLFFLKIFCLLLPLQQYIQWCNSQIILHKNAPQPNVGRFSAMYEKGGLTSMQKFFREIFDYVFSDLIFCYFAFIHFGNSVFK